MEASTTRRSSFGGQTPKDLLSSRKGSLLLAAVIAFIAGVLIFLFVDSRSTGGGIVGGGSQRVLVAKKLIPKGSSGELVAAQGFTAAQTIDTGDVKEGAVADPAALAGTAAVADVYPGQQITTADFTAAGAGIATRLGADQRAIAIPVDATHSVAGNVATGDRVDIYVSTEGDDGALVKALMSNVLVLSAGGAAPSGGAATGGGGGSNVILRTKAADAGKLAFAADNARLWLVLRPPVGARPTPDGVVRLDTLLSGSLTTQEGGTD